VATGDIITDADFRKSCGEEKYDLVLANILADIIIPLSGVIKENMKPGGLFVSSGIINTKEDAVREALLANGFEIVEVTYSGDWVSFTARK
jgi:ribosomal protein L11 methyltransferase